ncbi:MAG TPA: hypothetical protein VE779_14545, partial [Candidatus Angelobacter sp.]|nr:hypothetical protein [Candidatus Angelobacter sp.]
MASAAYNFWEGTTGTRLRLCDASLAAQLCGDRFDRYILWRIHGTYDTGCVQTGSGRRYPVGKELGETGLAFLVRSTMWDSDLCDTIAAVQKVMDHASQ